MKRILFIGLATFGAAFTSLCLTVLAQDYQPALTEYGQPDLSGVWNFSSNTPLERPERFGETEFLRDVDTSATNTRRTSSSPRSGPNTTGVIGAYNSYWNDRAQLQQNERTSLIVHPTNGRIPPVNDGVHVQPGGDITTDVDYPKYGSRRAHGRDGLGCAHRQPAGQASHR